MSRPQKFPRELRMRVLVIHGERLDTWPARGVCEIWWTWKPSGRGCPPPGCWRPLALPWWPTWSTSRCGSCVLTAIWRWCPRVYDHSTFQAEWCGSPGHLLEVSELWPRSLALFLYCTTVGEALCRELSKHGALLIMSARSDQTMETIKQSLAHPENAKSVQTSSVQ